jgi:putative ABC transport system substrate-binding protein
MRRRDFIKGIAVSTTWPLAARAQQPLVRRIGVIVPATADDPEFHAWIGAFLQGLALLGWTIGNNVRLEIRWAGGNADDIRRHATELVALAPDIILAHGASTASRVLQATHTVPIVFPVVFDPVGAGLVDSLARPGGNVTGFMPSEYSIGGKWLDLLKQISPNVTRVAVFRDTTTPTGAAMFGVIQAAASPLGLEVTALNMRDAGEIQRGITEFVRSANGCLVVTASGLAAVHRDLIISLAAKHKLPAVYYERLFVASGGLISYGADFVDLYRRAAGYVDRILRGEKPADLPVQASTKYTLAINLKTAKALGLAIPPAVLASTDEVIE